MLIPPFCPNADCPYHTDPPVHEQWFHLAGTYDTKAFGTVTRFRCQSCGKTFGEQTFRLDYYAKRKLSYQQIFQHLTNCGGIRATARIFGVHHSAITNRIGRMARQSMALQAELLAGFTPNEALVTDGFESFVSDQYQPNNFNLLVGKWSQFLFGYDYSHLRRKGRMTEQQKEERKLREATYIRECRTISQSFRQIVDMVEQFAQRRAAHGEATCLYSDEKQEYPRVLAESYVLQALAKEKKFFHYTCSSKMERTTENPLFAVNYYDRELRKDNADHVRETVRFSRNVNNALERFAVYQLYHNFFKSYRVDHVEKRYYTHGEAAGIDGRLIRENLRDIFTMRRFFTHVKLKLSWSQLIIWARMTGTLDKHDGVFWPKYVWM
jgi:transposase-like protein